MGRPDVSCRDASQPVPVAHGGAGPSGPCGHCHGGGGIAAFDTPWQSAQQPFCGGHASDPDAPPRWRPCRGRGGSPAGRPRRRPVRGSGRCGGRGCLRRHRRLRRPHLHRWRPPRSDLFGLRNLPFGHAGRALGGCSRPPACGQPAHGRCRAVRQRPASAGHQTPHRLISDARGASARLVCLVSDRVPAAAHCPLLLSGDRYVRPLSSVFSFRSCPTADFCTGHRCGLAVHAARCIPRPCAGAAYRSGF